MSERGSFVTEYMYCLGCFRGLKKVLLKKEKFLCSTLIPTWKDNPNPNEVYLPIIAGKVGESFSGGEIFVFDTELRLEIETAICHPVRIAVIAESSEEIFTFHPNGDSI